MRIRKVYKSSVPEGKIMNAKSDSINDTYSCEYINSLSKEMTLKSLLTDSIEAGSNNTTVTASLLEDVSTFDMIVVIVRGDWNHVKSIVVPKGYYGWTWDCWVGSNTTYYGAGYVQFPTTTSLKLTWEAGGFGLTVQQVLGINFN